MVLFLNIYPLNLLAEMKRATPWGTLLTNYLPCFREQISWKTALLIAEQFSQTACPVMWEKLNLLVNLKD